MKALPEMGGLNVDFGHHDDEMIHVVLYDDDRSFGVIMERIAEQYKIRLTFCHSWEDFKKVLDWKTDTADVLIIDYDLGEQTGVEMATRLPPSLKACPVILVSGSQHVDVPISAWPDCIKGFLQKEIGPFAILEAALAAHDAALVAQA
jgi:DNA-binding NtrC family response regulator